MQMICILHRNAFKCLFSIRKKWVIKYRHLFWCHIYSLVVVNGFGSWMNQNLISYPTSPHATQKMCWIYTDYFICICSTSSQNKTCQSQTLCIYWKVTLKLPVHFKLFNSFPTSGPEWELFLLYTPILIWTSPILTPRQDRCWQGQTHMHY